MDKAGTHTLRRLKSSWSYEKLLLHGHPLWPREIRALDKCNLDSRAVHGYIYAWILMLYGVEDPMVALLLSPRNLIKGSTRGMRGSVSGPMGV